MRRQTETGIILSQAKELLGLPEARRGRKDPPLEASEGAWPCQHLSFRCLASRIVRE